MRAGLRGIPLFPAQRPHPVRSGRTVRTYAWLERSARRLHGVRAELAQEGQIKAAAAGKFMEVSAEL